ncbi:hypothetical protein HQ397_04235 [Aeromonas hydrophila]|uniref:hypothetical protein n=1 Tax=Aeromonas hydrophila TaxID=644 RepID=UPI001C797EA4|nr:hypothetical protein [Aeromonas hydrophila]QWL69417.1 hypothetical protein HQ397_04235 [Aeromonas hydrophila]
MGLKNGLVVMFFLVTGITSFAAAEEKPTREDFIAAAKDRYAVSKPSEKLIDNLREEVYNFNTKAPIHYGNDVYLTSASVNEQGIMIARFTAKSATRFQVNPVLIKEGLMNIACSTEAIYRGFDAGFGASMLLTTVDGLDIDTGIINKTRCSKYKQPAK